MNTNLTVCAYEGGPAVAVRTGANGQYGLCADCAEATDRTTTVGRFLDNFRHQLRATGQLTDGVDAFLDRLQLVAPLMPGRDALAMMTAALAPVGGAA